MGRFTDMVTGRDFFSPADALLGLSIVLGDSNGLRPRRARRVRTRPHVLEPGECTLRETGSKRSQRRARAKAKSAKK